VGTLQDKGALRIYHNEHTILQGTLPYFVHYPEEDDEEEEGESIDWEITPDPYSLLNNPHTTMRLIRITFNKAVPMAGLVVWWTKPLMHFPDIDLKDIESRTTADTNTSNRMREAWEEAHRLFQEKIKSKDKISI
jgi:Ser-tRNA(Ala) deacylase AlaX